MRLAHARNDEAGATEFAWFQDADVWSVGVQADFRDETFPAIGRSLSDLETSVAGNVSVDLGVLGAAGFTAASVSFFEDEEARTFTASYSPRLAEGSINARVVYTEREDSELAFTLTFSTSLTDDVSGASAFNMTNAARPIAPRCSARLTTKAAWVGGRGPPPACANTRK